MARTDKLKLAVAALKTAAQSLHAAVADNGSKISQSDGLAAMAAPLSGAVVPSGRPVDATVAATHTIYPGDTVRWCSEVAVNGDALRLALSDVKILAAKEMRFSSWWGKNGAVVAFTQDGYTKIKTVYIASGSAELTLGPTLVLSEDEAVELVMGVYDDEFCWILYTCDAGTHYYTKVACLDGPTGELILSSDLFTAEGLDDLPKNLAISHGTQDEGSQGTDNYVRYKAPRAVIGYTKGDAAYLNSAAYIDGQVIVGAEYEIQGLADADYDAYYHAWDIAWGVDALYIAYPVKGKTNLYGLKTLGCWCYGRNAILRGEVQHFEDHSVGTVTSPFGCAVPTASVYPCREWTHGTILAHGVTRLSNSGGALKSTLALTTWAAGIVPEVQPDPPEWEEGEERYCNHIPSVIALGAAEADVAYNSSIGLIALSDYAEDTTLVAYCHESTMYALPITWRECQSLGGNAVALGTFEEFGAVVAVPNYGGLYIYQQDGAAYVKPLAMRSVVIPADADHAEGVAVRGGSGGMTIPVRKSE